MLMYNLTDIQLKMFVITAWDLGHANETKSFKESLEQRYSDLEAAFPWLFKTREATNVVELPTLKLPEIDQDIKGEK